MLRVAGAVVIEVEVGVELFAGEEVVVGRCPRLVQQVSKGVVVVGVGDGAGGTCERAYAAVAVIDVVDGLQARDCVRREIVRGALG